MHKTQDKILKLMVAKDISGMSYREIGGEIGEKHAQNVAHHLNMLRKNGLISITKYRDKQYIKSLRGEGLLQEEIMLILQILGIDPVQLAAVQSLIRKAFERHIERKNNPQPKK